MMSFPPDRAVSDLESASGTLSNGKCSSMMHFSFPASARATIFLRSSPSDLVSFTDVSTPWIVSYCADYSAFVL